jgi:hypothetical protein
MTYKNIWTDVNLSQIRFAESGSEIALRFLNTAAVRFTQHPYGSSVMTAKAIPS